MLRDSEKAGIITVVLVLGAFILIGLFSMESKPKCWKEGCNREATSDSNYCYLHELYSGDYTRGKSGTSSSSSGSSSSGSSYSGGSTSSSSKTYEKKSSSSSSGKKYNSSSFSKKSSKKTYHDTYDDGYNDVYEDDDYDTDRYNSDWDYATGVDDALDDLEEEGEGW